MAVSVVVEHHAVVVGVPLYGYSAGANAWQSLQLSAYDLAYALMMKKDEKRPALLSEISPLITVASIVRILSITASI